MKRGYGRKKEEEKGGNGLTIATAKTGRDDGDLGVILLWRE